MTQAKKTRSSKEARMRANSRRRAGNPVAKHDRNKAKVINSARIYKRTARHRGAFDYRDAED